MVFDGPIRDIDAIRRWIFPSMERVRHRGPYKEGPGEINVPIACRRHPHRTGRHHSGRRRRHHRHPQARRRRNTRRRRHILRQRRGKSDRSRERYGRPLLGGQDPRRQKLRDHRRCIQRVNHKLEHERQAARPRAAFLSCDVLLCGAPHSDFRRPGFGHHAIAGHVGPEVRHA